MLEVEGLGPESETVWQQAQRAPKKRSSLQHASSFSQGPPSPTPHPTDEYEEDAARIRQGQGGGLLFVITVLLRVVDQCPLLALSGHF